MSMAERGIPNHALKHERQKRSWSQEDVAEKIGTSAVNISRWERGSTFPTPYYRQRLCELYAQPPEVLFPFASSNNVHETYTSQTLPQPERLAERDNSPLPAKVPLHVLEMQSEREKSYDSVFHFNTPLTNHSEFYGRAGEWITLRDRLQKHSSTSIVGQRRIGKTWLMTYMKLVASLQFGASVVTGYLDATMPACSTLPGLLAETLKELGEPRILHSSAALDMVMLEIVVRNIIARRQTPVLCIDEFEGFCKHPDFDLNFFEHLRAITQVGLVLVTASKHTLLDIISERFGEDGKTSPFFNVFEQITLKPFTMREAQMFAQAKSAQAQFTEQERTHLLRYGQWPGQQWPPMRLQLVGKMLETDKTLAACDDPDRYRPDAPLYWQEFERRLEEVYRGGVR